MAAALRGTDNICRMLLSHGADPNTHCTQYFNQTALIYSVISSERDDSILELFLTLPNLELNATNGRNETALMIAAAKGRLRAVSLLIQANANIEARDDNGQTILHQASAKGNVEVIDLLVNVNANVNAPDNEGKTPLMVAANSGQLKAVKALIKANASITIEDKRDLNAYIWAKLLSKDCPSRQDIINLLRV